TSSTYPIATLCLPDTCARTETFGFQITPLQLFTCRHHLLNIQHIYKDESGRRQSTPLDVNFQAGRQPDSKLDVRKEVAENDASLLLQRRHHSAQFNPKEVLLKEATNERFLDCGGIVYPSPVKVRKRALRMTTKLFNRRDFSLRLTSIFSVLGARTAMGAGRIPRAAPLADDYGISHTADAIHQEVVFRASRKRIYDALTDTKQFDRIIQLSKAGMSYGKKP